MLNVGGQSMWTLEAERRTKWGKQPEEFMPMSSARLASRRCLYHVSQKHASSPCTVDDHLCVVRRRHHLCHRDQHSAAALRCDRRGAVAFFSLPSPLRFSFSFSLCLLC